MTMTDVKAEAILLAEHHRLRAKLVVKVELRRHLVSLPVAANHEEAANLSPGNVFSRTIHADMTPAQRTVAIRAYSPIVDALDPQTSNVIDALVDVAACIATILRVPGAADFARRRLTRRINALLGNEGPLTVLRVLEAVLGALR